MNSDVVNNNQPKSIPTDPEPRLAETVRIQSDHDSQNPRADDPIVQGVSQPESSAGIISEVNQSTMMPHAHADPRLWAAFARPHLKAVFDQQVKTAKNSAAIDMQAALGVVVKGEWPSLDACIPPGSILELIDKAFVEESDIPREIPFFATLHYISALLLQKGVGISLGKQRLRPDIWSICLAESGSGKTFAQVALRKALNAQVEEFPDAASAAKFIENLRDFNKGLWCRDEFAQFLKAIETQQHMMETKDYLLRCYDGEKLTRNTKGGNITVEEPALTIFGSTVFKTIKDNLTPEMLLDGFAQRFAFIVAKRNPDRPLQALYRVDIYQDEIREAWKEIEKKGIRAEYRISSVGESSFEQAFQLLLIRSRSVQVNESYLRRINFRATKYALIYHILLGKDTDYLDEEDFGYAARLCALNLRDMRLVLDEFELSKYQENLNKVIAWLLRQKAENRIVKPRDLTAGVRGIKNAATAKSLLEQIKESNPELASTIDLGNAQAPTGAFKAKV